MQVEPALHELAGVAPEVAIVVVVGEARRGHPRPRRQCLQLRSVRLAERPVDGLKFVVLILAHRQSSPVFTASSTSIA